MNSKYLTDIISVIRTYNYFYFPVEGRLKSQLSSTPIYSVFQLLLRRFQLPVQMIVVKSLSFSLTLSLFKAIKLFKDLKIDSKGNPA